MDKFKIIKEYDNFYLCENEKFGYKECFNKAEYKPENGYIIRKRTIYNLQATN